MAVAVGMLDWLGGDSVTDRCCGAVDVQVDVYGGLREGPKLESPIPTSARQDLLRELKYEHPISRQ